MQLVGLTKSMPSYEGKTLPLDVYTAFLHNTAVLVRIMRGPHSLSVCTPANGASFFALSSNCSCVLPVTSL